MDFCLVGSMPFCKYEMILIANNVKIGNPFGRSIWSAREAISMPACATYAYTHLSGRYSASFMACVPPPRSV